MSRLLRDNVSHPSPIALILKASATAAQLHRLQYRKDKVTPYINHPLEVADCCANVGAITDPNILAAALLHDTLEDTALTQDELRAAFGSQIAQYVIEVTDDKTLPKQQRKDRQISDAPFLSAGAKQIKLADKICNLRSMVSAPPQGWGTERIVEYINWSEQVGEKLSDASQRLAELLRQTVHDIRVHYLRHIDIKKGP